MPAHSAPVPAGCVLRADGSVLVRRHARPVEISAPVAAAALHWAAVSGDTPFEPHPCWSCGARALYRTASRRVRSELVVETWACGGCGAVDHEPID